MTDEAGGRTAPGRQLLAFVETGFVRWEISLW